MRRCELGHPVDAGNACTACQDALAASACGCARCTGPVWMLLDGPCLGEAPEPEPEPEFMTAIGLHTGRREGERWFPEHGWVASGRVGGRYYVGTSHPLKSGASESWRRAVARGRAR